jgi:hypothetical protein
VPKYRVTSTHAPPSCQLFAQATLHEDGPLTQSWWPSLRAVPAAPTSSFVQSLPRGRE